MKAIVLDKPTLTAAMKVVWQLIEDADGLQYPARQVQLMTDITNVLVPFGFDCETTIVWDYFKEGTLVNYFCGFYPYRIDVSCGKPKAVVGSFSFAWHDRLPIEVNKKRLTEHFHELYLKMNLYLTNLKKQ